MVRLQGTLKNFTNPVKFSRISDLEFLQPADSNRYFEVDSAGHFVLEFDLSEPAYFRLANTNMILLLSPGDDLTMTRDYMDWEYADYVGKGAEINTYLKDIPFAKSGSYLAFNGIQNTPEATLDTIMSRSRQQEHRLAKVQNMPEKFRALENMRITADVINSINQLSFRLKYSIKLSEDSSKNYIDRFNQLATPILDTYIANDLINADFLMVDSYEAIRHWLSYLSAEDNPEWQKIKDWEMTNQLIRQMTNETDKKALEVYVPRIADLSDERYREAAYTMLNELKKFGKGDLAVDFTAVDISGKGVSLSSLRGKVIFVDLWATWCGPCMAEMPEFENLKKDYQHHSDIVFVSLSIDSNTEGWRNSVASRQADGIQWNISANRLKDYNVSSIPRILIIGKDFTIAEMQGPRPSSRTAREKIDALLD
jgi:thiol-disulfide isomerase/thioredoxin